jgi:peptidoglycan/LPS O-acetylase OafA/YrhL
LPGLDGLRSLAVTAVLLYHAGVSWIPGGFLGVEVFFVISGYLITCVLLSERQRTGGVSLKRFWFRRARRLLPAVFVLLLAVMAAAVLFYPDEVTELRFETLAALGYGTNWYFLADQQSYFEFVGRPSLVQHLWSLAIEEQFYLVWPVAFFVLVGRVHRMGIVGLLVCGAIASTVLMAVLWHPGADPSRVYYGTDTRVAGLLMGAALAFVWAPWSVPLSSPGRKRVIALNLAGVGALAALVYLLLTLNQYEALLYRGGFALVAICTALAIAVAVHPRAHLRVVLGLWPLRWLGTRSYAVYLWHWPVFMLTRPDVDVSIDGIELLALRFGITLALAELSYRLVERPVRSGGLGRAWGNYRDGRGFSRWVGGLRWGTPLGAVATTAAVLAVFAITAEPPAPPPYLSVRAVNIVSPARLADARGQTATPTPAPTARTPEAGPVPEPRAPTAPVAPPPQGSAALPGAAYLPVHIPVTAIGDSVMVAAAPELAAAIPGAEVDAAIGRQVQAALALLQQRSAAGGLGEAVVLHVGNNGTFTAGLFDSIMGVLADRRVVVFVNVKVPRDWEGPNNGVIASGVGRHGNAALVDWQSASASRPELFYGDGIHLRPDGVRLYTSLITQELARHPPPPPPPTQPPPAEITPPPPPVVPPPTEPPIFPPPAPTPVLTPPPTPVTTPAPTAPPELSPTPSPSG